MKYDHNDDALRRAVEATVQEHLYGAIHPIVPPVYEAPRWTEASLRHYRALSDEVREMGEDVRLVRPPQRPL